MLLCPPNDRRAFVRSLAHETLRVTVDDDGVRVGEMWDVGCRAMAIDGAKR